MDEPQYRVCIQFRYGARGCVWAANNAAMARFPTNPMERYLSLSPDTRRLLQRLQAQSDGHADANDRPWAARERERFECRVRMAVAAVRAELGSDYEVEYWEG
jgi:hypothetical protein